MEWDLSVEAVLLAAGIFLLRVTDVSIGTVRTIFTVNGRRFIAAALGFAESLVWIYAISRLVSTIKENPANMFAWALGFAAGNFVGITIEQWIASGSVLVRIISRNHAIRLKELLQSEGYGVTVVHGEGRGGTVLVIFVVTPRRKKNDLLASVKSVDPDAFVTVEPVSQAIGGYPMVSAIEPTSVRK